MSNAADHDNARDAPAAPTAEPVALPPAPAPGLVPEAGPRESAGGLQRLALGIFALVAVAGLVSSVMLWQKLSGIQEQLARQSADAGNQAIEARTLARQAQDLARDTATRQAVVESRLGEVALQRTQLEDLMQSLSRTRDDSVLDDIESALRLAQQQAQLTLSAEPLLVALRAAEERLARSPQPRLVRARAAVARDIERIKAAGMADVPGVLLRLDELSRQVDELPVANAVGPSSAQRQAPRAEAPAPALPWWRQALAHIGDELRGLVRVSRIAQPEAVLLAPEQAFFLRENLKLKLLNARLGLLARQTDAARADVAAAATALNKYFDGSSRRTQAAAATLQQVQAQLRQVEVPRIDDTLAVLATTAAGR